MKSSYQRFSLGQRLEHVGVMTLFTLLSVTGLPQKFFEAGWARAVIRLFGGIESTRIVHRGAALLFSILVAIHLGRLVIATLRRTVPLSMVPTRRDFTDTLGTLRYYVGLAPRHPPYERFDYKQKFEYWGLVMGSLIMIASGFLLFFPTFFTRLLPGVLIPAAKVAHSNEGLMAVLVVTVWHIYSAHFNPDVFPFDRTIFNGRISRERMEKEHSLELERIEAAAGARGEAADS